MRGTVAQMTKAELRALIAETIKLKLLELLKDPDAGLELREDVRDRLRRSFAAEARGERGIKAQELSKRLNARS
jgi:hypothetical protein